jgi:hypothetical protein
MFDLRKFFAKDASPSDRPVTDDGAPLAHARGDGLEVEYERLIQAQFGRLGISSSCTTIEVRRIGHGPHGFDVLVAMVRLHRWERGSALKLLLGLPLIESRVRKLVRSTWLADYSHFGGLWLHASEHLHEDPGTEELRELLASLAPPADTRHPTRTAPAPRVTPASAADAAAPHSAPLSG